jgi:hypothetical protein
VYYNLGSNVILFIIFFFLEAFCNISHIFGGISPFGVFSDAFPGLKMWVTFACATAKIVSHFIISIAVLKNVPPDAGLQKTATWPGPGIEPRPPAWQAASLDAQPSTTPLQYIISYMQYKQSVPVINIFI